MSDKKIVTFKKEWRGYAVGEIAGFDVAAADALIESGRAKPYVDKAVPEKAGKAGAAKKKTAAKPPVADGDLPPEQPDQPEQLEQPEDLEPPELDEKP